MKNNPPRLAQDASADADDTRAALERLETEAATHPVHRVEEERKADGQPRRVVEDRISGGRSRKRREACVTAKTGLWIDHKRAVVVAVSAAGSVVAEVISQVDKQPGRLAGVRSVTPYESQLVQSDGCQSRRYTEQLNQYYARVIALLRRAGTVLILGPGEAKGELRKRLERVKAGSRVVTLETADKMTNRQIIARVRAHFEAEPQTGAARQGSTGNQRRHQRRPSRRARRSS